MVFCNSKGNIQKYVCPKSHNPYFNRWFSAIISTMTEKINPTIVTILILIDGFLQCEKQVCYACAINSHNPYFNRWFSAMRCLRQ